MNLNIGMVPTGHITVKKHIRNGRVTFEQSFDNVVLDVGWDNLVARLDYPDGSPSYYNHMVPQYLYLGTGTTEPLETDTGLESVSGTLAGKKQSGISYAGSDRAARVAAARQTFTYGEGEAEGVWTELGLAYGSTYTDPYNRALFRDDLGNPMSLTILSDEFLTVYIELRMYFPDPGQSGTFLYNGTTHDFTTSLNTGQYYSMVDDGSYHRNFWKYGVPRFLSYEGLVGKDAPTYDAATLTFTFPGRVIDPGAQRTITRLNFSNGYQSQIYAHFTQDVVVPSDHKLTIDGHSIQYSRGAVPV